MQHNTRDSQELGRMQTNDPTLFVPVILIRGENIEVVPHFRYLGVLDTDAMTEHLVGRFRHAYVE